MKNLFSIIIFIFSISLNAQSIRPVRDTVGFCWNPEEMDRFIEFLNEESSEEFKPDGIPVAAISPHDDYLYAGRVYSGLYKIIKAKEIVVFGVVHGTVRKAMNDPKNVLILDSFDYWRGPYGKVNVSPLREMIESELPDDFYLISNKAHSIEHSIEALIPFLQHYNRDLIITPIMVSKMPEERAELISGELAEVIKRYIKLKNYKPGKDIFFLISNDANHYGEDFNNYPFGLDSLAHEKATNKDKEIIEMNLACKITKDKIKNLTTCIWEDYGSNTPLWCGRFPIVFGLMTINKIVNELWKKNIEGHLIKYSDTLTEGGLSFSPTTMGFTAPVSEKHWVGFYSLYFSL